MLRLWQNEETGVSTWCGTKPSRKHYMIPLMYEDELPENIEDKVYTWWYGDSQVVDGVRMGPKI